MQRASLPLFSEIRMVSSNFSVIILLLSATVYLLILYRKLIVGELHSSEIPYSYFCNFIFSWSRSQELVL